MFVKSLGSWSKIGLGSNPISAVFWLYDLKPDLRGYMEGEKRRRLVMASGKHCRMIMK